MTTKTFQFETLKLDKIVGGGQALGTLADGRKAFVWGGLPGEIVTIRVTKKKSNYVEGIVTDVLSSSRERTKPLDSDSYLSTSPWQIMAFEAEQHYKAALIEEAFELHDIVLPNPIEIYTNGRDREYRNKMEFSWYCDISPSGETLDLAFFRRGSKGKIPITDSVLPHPAIMKVAGRIRDFLHSKSIPARELKTLLIRSDQNDNCVWQLYVKVPTFDAISSDVATTFDAQGGEVIYSDPLSPASRISKRLHSFGNTTLKDTVLGIPFHYATEGFFQVNLPVYEQSLLDMQSWIDQSRPTVDLYSGVGTIGLTVGGPNCTLVEVNEHAVREMKRNISEQGSDAVAVLTASEQALDHINSDATIIVDPPRAGLHPEVITKLLEVQPDRIIYLSCNPVTQARDVAMLAPTYGVRHHRGYNFFPRTPHIEHLVILEKA